MFDHGPGRAAGEPVFVGRPGGTDEDDGWLVTFVHDLPPARPEFVVLDAQDFDRGLRRPGAAPPAGAVRLPWQLGQRPGGCSARLGSCNNHGMLSPGTKAPDFELPDQNGEPVRLSDFTGKWVLMWWYPKAATPG